MWKNLIHKYSKENGTRNEYRIYHNRDIAKHELHFQPFEIVTFIIGGDNNFRIEHFTPRDNNYHILLETIGKSKIRGNHALLNIDEYNNLLKDM